MNLKDAIAGTFSFLRTGSQAEDRVAQYVIREHQRARPLADIVADHYVTNRCTPDQIARILERGDVIHAIGEDTILAMRTQL